MKVEEALGWLDTARLVLVNQCRKDAVESYTEAFGLAISALHTQQEENEPLTREQLQNMDGQPVWIEFYPDPGEEQVKIWALVSVDPDDGEIFLLNSLGGSSAYEEVWSDIKAIYRRPRKEGTA